MKQRRRFPAKRCRLTLRDPEFLFVYGTLKRCCRNRAALRLRREAVFVGEGSVQGKLYSLGYYPTMRPSERRADKVHGEVYRLRHPKRTFVWLDVYEFCAPDQPGPQEYARQKSVVFLAGGAKAEAWAYFDNRRDERPLLAGGRWSP